MGKLRQIREADADMDMRLAPVIETYSILQKYNACPIRREEIGGVASLRPSWQQLMKEAAAKTDELANLQQRFKKDLLAQIQDFRVSVLQFRGDYEENGVVVQGLAPEEALARLRKYQVYRQSMQTIVLTS